MMGFNLTDETIDLVARQLTNAEPPAQLRARVLSALDGSPTPRRLWWLPAAGFAAAALAVVIAWPGPGAAPTLPAVPTFAARAPFARALQVGTMSSVAAGSSATRTRLAANDTTGVAAAILAFRANGIPSLELGAPAPLDTIQPKPLELPLLVISPLALPATPVGSDGGK